jgi:hypothetical protein
MAFRRRRTVVLLATVLALSALVLASCGGSSSGDDEGSGDGGGGNAQALLDRAFSQPIGSADLDIDAQIEIDGLDGFEEPLRIEATGPYVRSKGKLPQLDLDVGIDAQGAGQTIQSGLLSTGDRVFLKFGGDFYEQPPEQVARNNRQLERNGKRGEGSLTDLGLDPGKWVVDASVEGDEQIGGVATEHVSGTLDVEALLDDLNGLVKRSAGALGGVGGAQPLRRRDIERLSQTVENPSFDVYVGKADDIVRRLSSRIEISVPEEDRGDVGGITGASIRLSAELRDVGGDQKVEPPSESRPLSDLTSQLGSLGSIAGDAFGGMGDEGAATTSDGGGDAPADGPTPDGAGADVFERYGECLERARPDDAEAITRCAELVR